MASAVRCLPLTVSTVIEDVASKIKTTVIVKRYTDKIFVIISQDRKAGTLMQGWMQDNDEYGNLSPTSVTTLIGMRDRPEYNVYLKHLVEFFNKSNNDTIVLLSIHLTFDGVGPDVFSSIMTFIKTSCSTW